MKEAIGLSETDKGERNDDRGTQRHVISKWNQTSW